MKLNFPPFLKRTIGSGIFKNMILHSFCLFSMLEAKVVVCALLCHTATVMQVPEIWRLITNCASLSSFVFFIDMGFT